MTITIVRTICEKGIISLTLRKSNSVQKKMASMKKRKRDNGEVNDLVEVNARVGGVMDTLDAHDGSSLRRNFYG